MAETGIDPRYAAQFQRGFDPAVHAPVKERRGPAPISPAPALVARRVPDPPPMVARTAAVTVESAAPLEDPLPIVRSRSEWALLAVGVVLLVVAGLLFWRSVEVSAMYSGVGPELSEQVSALAAGTLPGPLLVAGSVAIFLWIVLQAVRPRP